MSQIHVERVIGRLATDEAVRQRFLKHPREVLAEMIEQGMQLNECEQGSLASIDPRELARFAQTIDPRLQKIDPQGGRR